MYPARWFPVNDYTTDRFSSDLKVTVPDGYKVVASGTPEAKELLPAAALRFKFDTIVVSGQLRGGAGRAEAGVPGRDDVFLLAPDPTMATAYGEEIGKAMTFFTGFYGVPPQEGPDRGRDRGRRAQRLRRAGMIFFSPQGIGQDGQP